MSRINKRSLAALSWMVLLFVWGAGCNKNNYGAFIPQEETARWALECALTSWQDGQPPGRIEETTPPIEVVDSKWKAGQKLASFEILQAEPSDGPRYFSVRLTLDNTAHDKVTVRYVVLGREPLWVYREEDYNKLSGM